MPRSEPAEPTPSAWSFDWRGWLVLAWALGFGLLYARMVVETRGNRVRELLPPSRGTP